MKRSSGFTLIELLVVVGIMVLIATIVVTGSFGMSRASGYLAAENIVYNTLQAARQKACTDGKRVVVAFVKREAKYGDDNFALVTAEAVGTITEDVESTYIRDRCMSLKGRVNGTVNDSIWNLRTGAFVPGPFTIGKSSVERKIPGGRGSFSYDTVELKLSQGKSFDKKLWGRGDPYGFQIGEMQELPAGFQFGFGAVGVSPENKLVVFEPDGTSFHGQSSTTGMGNRSDNETSIFIYEEIAKAKAIEIKVKNGAVTVDRKD